MATTLDLEKMAETWEPRMRDAFLSAIRDMQNHIDVAALQRLIEKGDIAGALRAVGADPAHFNALALTQQSVYNAGGIATARAAPLLPQVGGYTARVLFDIRNPRAEAWVRTESSGLVKEIVDDQRVMIRNVLESGLQAGTNPRTVALDLVGRIDPRTKRRTGGVIGLSSNQEQWLRSYSADLASEDPTALRRLLQRGLRDKRFDASVLKAIRDGTPIPDALQTKMRTAYTNRALKWRGDVIARTETIKALGAAQTEAYQQSIDKGDLDQDLLLKFPVTAGDERVRQTHRMVPGMNKAGRKWNEPYETPFGPQMHAPYENQVGCRCHEKVVVRFLDAAIAKHKARNGA